MHIIIDFDYTLFDTNAFRNAMADVWSAYGVDRESYARAEEQAKVGGVYDFDRHVELLMSTADAVEARQRAQEVLVHCSQFLYSDALDFLERHAAHSLTLLSFGNPAWQRLKIDNSGISSHFKEIITTDRSKNRDLQPFAQFPDLVIINDKGSEIDAMATVCPNATFIHVVRPGTPYVEEPCSSASRTETNLSFSV